LGANLGRDCGAGKEHYKKDTALPYHIVRMVGMSVTSTY
jgi:hypothetical protein